jgi:hydrogenase maturation protease
VWVRDRVSEARAQGRWVEVRGGRATDVIAEPDGTKQRLQVLIGGVGYRWQRDASFGLIASDELSQLDWPPGVEVADLGYGAIYVAQDMADAQPPFDRVILLTGIARGRKLGQIYRTRWEDGALNPDDLVARIREAGAGVVDPDHLLVIAQHFGALPDDVVVIELEPVDVTGGEDLSPEAAGCLQEAIELARREAFAPRRREYAPSEYGVTTVRPAPFSDRPRETRA